jgi:TetR/AcrR family transcriptional repressor of nem operon
MGRPRSYDRDDVLERAMDLFWKKGFAGAHLQELVEVTGLNRFSLYNEFGGKAGLFRDALDRYLEQSRIAYEQTLGPEPRGLGNIRSYFDAIHYSRGYHGCLMINTLTEKHIVTSAAFRRARGYARDVECLFLENVRVAQERGELDSSRDASALAGLLAALDQGLAVYGIVEPSNAKKDALVGQLDALLG